MAVFSLYSFLSFDPTQFYHYYYDYHYIFVFSYLSVKRKRTFKNYYFFVYMHFFLSHPGLMSMLSQFLSYVVYLGHISCSF